MFCVRLEANKAFVVCKLDHLLKCVGIVFEQNFELLTEHINLCAHRELPDEV
jgi:hypothetical protein